MDVVDVATPVVDSVIEAVGRIEGAFGSSPDPQRAGLGRALLFGAWLATLYGAADVCMRVFSWPVPAQDEGGRRQELRSVAAIGLLGALGLPAIFAYRRRTLRVVALDLVAVAAASAAVGLYCFNAHRRALAELRREASRATPSVFQRVKDGVWRRPSLRDDAYCEHGVVVVGYPSAQTRWRTHGVRSLWARDAADWSDEQLRALTAHEAGHTRSAALFTLVNLVLLRGARRIPYMAYTYVRLPQLAAGALGVPASLVVLHQALTGTAWLNELVSDAHAGADGRSLLPLLRDAHRYRANLVADIFLRARTVDAYDPARGDVGGYSHPPLRLREAAFAYSAVVSSRAAAALFFTAHALSFEWIWQAFSNREAGI